MTAYIGGIYRRVGLVEGKRYVQRTFRLAGELGRYPLPHALTGIRMLVDPAAYEGSDFVRGRGAVVRDYVKGWYSRSKFGL